MNLPASWIALQPDSAVRLESELRREMCPAHQLHGRDLQAVAKREDRDDVLFRMRDESGPVFVVHLTWSVESEPDWPRTTKYKNMSDFLNRCEKEELKEDVS